MGSPARTFPERNGQTPNASRAMTDYDRMPRPAPGVPKSVPFHLSKEYLDTVARGYREVRARLESPSEEGLAEAVEIAKAQEEARSRRKKVVGRGSHNPPY